MAVGGDYKQPELVEQIVARTSDGGRTLDDPQGARAGRLPVGRGFRTRDERLDRSRRGTHRLGSFDRRRRDLDAAGNARDFTPSASRARSMAGGALVKAG